MLDVHLVAKVMFNPAKQVVYLAMHPVLRCVQGVFLRIFLLDFWWHLALAIVHVDLILLLLHGRDHLLIAAGGTTAAK